MRIHLLILLSLFVFSFSEPHFLTFIEDNDGKNIENIIQDSDKNSTTITEFLKCLNDLRPFGADVYQIYLLWKKGDDESKQKIRELVVKIGIDSITIGKDCYKLMNLF
jgi:hypothetical protein